MLWPPPSPLPLIRQILSRNSKVICQWSLNKFERNNWLPIYNRFEQYINSKTFIFSITKVLHTKDVFKPIDHPNTNSNWGINFFFLQIKSTLRKLITDKKHFHVYIAAIIWNSLLNYFKATEGLHAYKHKVKKLFFLADWKIRKEVYITISEWCYYY